MLRAFNPFMRIRNPMNLRNFRNLSSYDNTKIAREVNPGDEFRHYNGNTYIIRDVATDDETFEKLVIYYNASNPFHIWCRTLDTFNEFVEIPYNHSDTVIGRHIVPRFESIPKEQHYVHRQLPQEKYAYMDEYWIV